MEDRVQPPAAPAPGRLPYGDVVASLPRQWAAEAESTNQGAAYASGLRDCARELRQVLAHPARDDWFAREEIRQLQEMLIEMHEFAWTLSDKLGHRERLNAILKRALPAIPALPAATGDVRPAPELAELRELTANHEQLLATGMKPDAIRYHAEVAADRALLRGEVETLRELLDEIGVMAANAPEDGDSFGVLEQIAMRIAAVDVPAESPS